VQNRDDERYDGIYPEFNPLNAELNSIFPLLALFEAHHILHVSRIMVKTGARDFSSSKTLRPPLGPTQHPMSTGFLFFLWGKVVGVEVDHLPPSSAQVTNYLNCTYIPRIFPHGKAMNFTNTFNSDITIVTEHDSTKSKPKILYPNKSKQQ